MFSTQRVKFITLVTLFTFSLSACASKPYVPQVMKPTDRNLTCGDLDTEMKQAMQYKQMARKDDTFQWRYVLIIPAFLSAYNWHKAEKAADERIDYLESLSRQRGCAMGGGGYGAANPMMMQQMPSFPGGPNPTMPMRQKYPMQSPSGANPALGFAPSGVNPTNPLAPRGGTAPTGQYYTNKMSGQAINSVPTRYEPSGAFALPRSMQMQRKTMPQQQQARQPMYGSMPPNMMMRQPSMQPTTTRPNIPQYGGYAAPSQPTMSAPTTRTPVPNYQQFNNNYAPRAMNPSSVMARNPNVAAAPYPSYGYQPQQQIPAYAQQQRPSPSYTVPNQKASTAGYMY